MCARIVLDERGARAFQPCNCPLAGPKANEAPHPSQWRSRQRRSSRPSRQWALPALCWQQLGKMVAVCAGIAMLVAFVMSMWPH
jgi:hypothetical protein